jgi:aminoglycoside phosphotransferase
MTAPAPLPHNPRRMGWDEVPAHVRERIAGAAGSEPLNTTAANLGFSPGFAGIVEFAHGEQRFLKVMSATRDPWSIEFNRREAWVMSLLPAQAPAPRLAWTFDDGDWCVLATAAVAGDPARPGEVQAHAASLWDALSRVAAVPAPRELRPFAEQHSDLMRKWRELAGAEDRDARLASLDQDGTWISAHLDWLIGWEMEAAPITQGEALVHSDIRADNALIGPHGNAIIVDWPHAARGARWLDLALYLPSHAMNAGEDCASAFRAHPLSEGVSADAERALVAAIAGYFVVESTLPEVPALPGLRAFQKAQALPALEWLKRIAD